MPDKTPQKLKALRSLLHDRKEMVIVMQNYPDPDALASAAALREFAKAEGISSTLTSGGVVGRAENRALLRYLRLPLRHMNKLDFSKFDAVALVDTQPATGNNSLPVDVKADIVIDHHPIRKATRSVPFTDIRSRYGATSTILFEYLRDGGIPITTQIATALVYGIRSDTQELGREARSNDIQAILDLYPLANLRMLSEIQYSKTPREYFRMLETALRNAGVYDPCCIITSMGEIGVPDIVGEMADLLLRDEETEWSLVYGFYDGQMLLSLRTADREGDAGRVIQRIVHGLGTGGGHRAMAGGQVRISNDSAEGRKEAEEIVRKRFLRSIRLLNKPGEKLTARRKQGKEE